MVNGQRVELVVAADEANGEAVRLDRWLAARLPELSRARIQKLIEQSQVQVNEEICATKKHLVHGGDRVVLDIPDSQPLELTPEVIPLDVLYEDDELIILNKPTGMVVHPAPGHATGTLVHALLAHCPDLAGIGGVQRPGIVHRLDKDTSGAIAIAKTDQAHRHLQAQLKAKTAGRIYLAVVYGAPTTDSGTIDAAIGRHPIDRKKMAIVDEARGGRRAVTHWRIVERLGNFTLMEFRLETGRTHQIRVHAASIGHPVVGDRVYGAGRSVGVNLSGQALHAWKLTVQHPQLGESIEAIAPLPDTLTTLIRILRQRAGG
jgi:23S rRNA pseudouridine1911/1915/1917 synthase